MDCNNNNKQIVLPKIVIYLGSGIPIAVIPGDFPLKFTHGQLTRASL